MEIIWGKLNVNNNMIQNNSNYIKKQIHLSKRANKEVNGHRCLIFHSGIFLLFYSIQIINNFSISLINFLTIKLNIDRCHF